MNIYDAWEDENSGLAPISDAQQEFLRKLEEECKHKGPDEENLTENTLNTISSLSEFLEKTDSFDQVCTTDKDILYRKLVHYSEQCKEVHDIVARTLKGLDSLAEQYGLSSSKTNSLHDSCEQILQQQHGLLVAVEAISSKLAYFKEMQNMSKKLSSPTSLILSESLMPTLTRLDECISFLEAKPNYKESQAYLKNFKHLQSQALVTIKNQVVFSLQQIVSQVLPKQRDTMVANDNVFTLFYGRFQAGARRIKSLVIMIEERLNKDETYKQYLLECHETYFSARQTLILPVLTAAIEEMVASHKRSYCSLTRNTSNMLVHICRDEHQLFFQFFTAECDMLNSFLESLCVQLYDVLRAIIIRVEHLEILAELCSIIKYEIIDDPDDQPALEPFYRVMMQLLEDTQERLVYRTNIYVKDSIIGYCPAQGDLAYPEKLKMMESIAECMNNSSVISRSCSAASMTSGSFCDIVPITDASSRHSSTSPADVHGMWYPTVRRSIMCLTKLYRSLDREAFQGLAQEVLSGCLESLDLAASKISAAKSPVDGFLFQIKHLLVIREQISPFRFECSFREVSLDFSKVKSAALDILYNRENVFSFTNSNSLLKLLLEVPGAPQVIDQVVDPQRTIDNKIKITCEQFISHTADNLSQPIFRLTELIQNLHTINPDSVVTTITEQINSSKQSFTDNLEACRGVMSLYMSSKDTENILFKPVQTQVVKNIDHLLQLMSRKLSPEQLASVKTEEIVQLKRLVTSN